MPQASLTSLWSSKPEKKRKEPEGSLPQQLKPQPKRLRQFGPDGEGLGFVDEETRERVREKLGGLNSIANIKRRSKKKDVKVQLKPMHQQIKALKSEHADTILLVEEGYKYRVYADDAVIVSRALGFYLADGRLHFEDGYEGEDQYETFATCSFPVTSLQRHTKKLVDLGHKVGIVQQMEQAALAKSGKLLKRELTRKYTKATFADEYQVHEDEQRAPSNYLFALCEKDRRFAVVAVEPATGDIIYDEFVDGVMLTELETRLLHIQPAEMLHVGELSPRVKKLVSTVSQSRTENVLVHYKDVDSLYHTALLDHFTAELEACTAESHKTELSRAMDLVDKLPALVQQCVHALVVHLREYNMSHVFSIYKNYSTFSSQAEMYLSGDTLTSLEIFQNQHDQSSTGSLFELLDQTRTQFGRRLLKKWVGKPLLDRTEIEKRVVAVQELTRPVKKVGMVAEHLRYCMDLEKALANIYYGRSARPQLYKFLQKMKTLVTMELEQAGRLQSSYLNDLLDEIPKHRDTILGLWNYIDSSWQAKYENENKQDHVELFLNTDVIEDEQIFERRFDLQQTEGKLEAHLKELKQQLKIPLIYGTYGDQPYVIELDSKHKNKVPHDWVPFAKTTHKHKYRSPECEKLFNQYEKDKSLLVTECERAYKEYLAQVSEHYNEFRDLISALAQLDCIMSLSELARHGHYTMAKYTDNTGIQVVSGRHPTAENLLDVDYIANDISIDSQQRVKVVTGANMGGKSSYVRQVALIAIMAQIGSFVPADEATIGPFDAVYTRMGAYDNMIRGQSTFKVELQECGIIMNKATPRSLVILDEVGRGTSTTDGHAIAHAVLSYFISDVQCATLFITHYPALASVFGSSHPSIVSCHRMGVEYISENEVRFTYRLEKGVAEKSYGLNVARIAGLPSTILENAQAKSGEMASNRELAQLVEFYRRAVGADETLSRDVVAQVVSMLS